MGCCLSLISFVCTHLRFRLWCRRHPEGLTPVVSRLGARNGSGSDCLRVFILEHARDNMLILHVQCSLNINEALTGGVHCVLMRACVCLQRVGVLHLCCSLVAQDKRAVPQSQASPPEGEDEAFRSVFATLGAC